MKSKSVRPDYFFFRAFAFFAFFAFLFFAIAALLATGCGDVGTVNIVDRRSLHLDYTRAIEKTPTPINSECTRPRTPLDSIRMSSCNAQRAYCKCANHPPDATKTMDIAKTLMESAFSRMVKIRNITRVQQKSLRHPQLASAASRGAVSFPPDPKKFSTDRVLKRCADHESIKNERIGHWLIRDTMRSRAPFEQSTGIQTMPPMDNCASESRLMPVMRARTRHLSRYRL